MVLVNRVPPKAPLVELKLLPPIYLSLLVQYLRFFFLKFILDLIFHFMWLFDHKLSVLGHWTQRKKRQPSTKHGSWKNQEKLPENGCFTKKMHFGLFLGSFSYFFQELCFVEGCVFLHCVQCPKTLNLSYQKQYLEIFSNFSP